MTNNDKGMTLTQVRSLIQERIDDARSMSIGEPPITRTIECIILGLFTHTPRSARIRILQQMVIWEERFGKVHPEGVGMEAPPLHPSQINSSRFD